jgi:tetratricopeptide (TPR) repeat protein
MTTTIEKYNDLQKKILNNFAIRWDGENCKTTFRNDVKKFYGFEKEFGWNIILNSYYIIDNTELAKNSFKQFELQGPSRHKDIGERYLRLYGLLNSVYQQKLAIDNLMEVFKLPNQNKFSKKLAINELLILRNKIGAHPSNYRDVKEDSEHKFDVYEISRSDLQMDKLKLLRNQNHFEDYNLTKAIKDFDKLIEEILCEMTGKIIKKLFKNQGEIYADYQRINDIKNGAIIIGKTIIRFENNKA